jgi:anti-anti-sigma factor
MADLQITQRIAGNVTIIRLCGALVYEEAAALRAVVTTAVHANARLFLLDLEQITRLDSSGIGLLVAMFRHVTRHGGHLKLLRPSPTARRVLGISHMTMVFDIFDEESDALLNLGAQAG